MKKLLFYANIVSIILAITVYFYEFTQGAGYMLSDYFYLLPPAIATLSGLYILEKYSLKSKTGVSLLFIFLGVILWFLGELSWTYQENFLGIYPFPSYADILYLAAYPLFMVGLIKYSIDNKVSVLMKEKGSLFAYFLITLLGVLFISYYGVIKAYTPEGSFLENLISELYGIGDLMLLLGSLAVYRFVMILKNGTLANPWKVLVFAFLATLLADLAFLFLYDMYETEQGLTYISLDILWMLSYSAFSLAFIKFGDVIDKSSLRFTKK